MKNQTCFYGLHLISGTFSLRLGNTCFGLTKRLGTLQHFQIFLPVLTKQSHKWPYLTHVVLLGTLSPPSFSLLSSAFVLFHLLSFSLLIFFLPSLLLFPDASSTIMYTRRGVMHYNYFVPQTRSWLCGRWKLPDWILYRGWDRDQMMGSRRVLGDWAWVDSVAEAQVSLLAPHEAKRRWEASTPVQGSVSNGDRKRGVPNWEEIAYGCIGRTIDFKVRWRA